MAKAEALRPLPAPFVLVAFLTAALSVSQVALALPPGDSTRPADLVEPVKLDTTIRLDIRYATNSNFTGRTVYPAARAFLQRPAAEALLRAQTRLHGMGYGLVIFDAYRPLSITRLFWNLTPKAKRKFVANPAKGSKHNRGCAVDCSLVRLSTGEEVEMTSPYDDFTEKAAAAYRGGTVEQHRVRDILRKVMEEEGFAVNPDEWWHFDYRDWRYYPILDIPFNKLH